MSIVVRRADLAKDQGLIIDTLLRYLTPHSTPARYEWLYNTNPHGPARAWVATNTDNQSVIGLAAAFPRRVYCKTGEALAWVLGDFCVDGQFRSLGPALQLQRACLDAVQAEGVEFCFDFPSTAMLAVYKRLGFFTTRHMLRLAIPLRTDRKFRELIKLPLAVRTLSTIGNFFLLLRNRGAKDNNSVCIEAHRGPCGEEFTLLAAQMCRQQGCFVIHSPEYLNWRYLQNPLYKYEIFTARRDGDLLGSAVFLHERDDAMLVDLFGIDDEAILGSLVGHGVKLMAERCVQTLSAAVSDSHPWRGLLENQGFKTREITPMVIYAPRDAGQGCQLEVEKWRLMHGDRDS